MQELQIPKDNCEALQDGPDAHRADAIHDHPLSVASAGKKVSALDTHGLEGSRQ